MMENTQMEEVNTMGGNNGGNGNDVYTCNQVSDACGQTPGVAVEPGIITQMDAGGTGAGPGLYGMGLLADEFDIFADKLEEARTTGKPIGPISGFDVIDRQLCGAFQQGLYVLTGNTGAGKTAFASQIAAQCGCPAMYVSCEMSRLELLRRTAARITKTPLQQFKDPVVCLPAAVLKSKVRKAIQAVPSVYIVDGIEEFASPQYIIERAEGLKVAAGSDHVLVVIDSLHSWAAWLNSEEYERLTQAVASLRKVSARLSCPILLISEQSKAVNRQSAQGSSVGSSSPAGNRVIEYQSESVINLLSGNYDSSTGQTDIKLTFDKNRNGSQGFVLDMKFTGKFQSYEVAP